MFSVYCKHCGATLLLGPANIVAIQNKSDGIVVRFRCYRGHEGLWRNADDAARRPLVRTGGHGATGDSPTAPSTVRLTIGEPAHPAPRAPLVRSAHATAQPGGQRLRTNRSDPLAAGSSTPSEDAKADGGSSHGNDWRPEWARWSRTPWRRPSHACAGTAAPRRGSAESGS
jgi:hypothetical protein